jgi:hypothetical protein
MKLLNIRLLFALVVTAIFGTGCLKDDNYDDGRYGINLDGASKIAEIAGPVDGFVNIDLVGSPNDTTVDIVVVRLAGGVADKDVQVTLQLDPNVVDAYNTEHGTSYVVPAATQFSIPSMTVTIPAGQKTGSLRLTAKPNNLFGADEYALGVKIASVSDPSVKVSGNFNSQVVGLTIRNKYDGEYTMTGTLVDVANAALTAKSPQRVHLITTGANSVYLHNAGTNVASFKDLFPILSAGSESAYGSFTPEFTFDANNNVISVVNAYGQPAGNGRSAQIDPSGVNKWDPATKTLKVKWFMTQPPTPGIRTTFDFTFTYVGPR